MSNTLEVDANYYKISKRNRSDRSIDMEIGYTCPYCERDNDRDITLNGLDAEELRSYSMDGKMFPMECEVCCECTLVWCR